MDRNRKIPPSPAWKRRTGLGLLVISAVVALTVGASTSAAPQAASSPTAAQYLPSISDMMIATIQPRHERLWRAGREGNWEFAAYELGNLHGAFERVATLRGREYLTASFTPHASADGGAATSRTKAANRAVTALSFFTKHLPTT